MGKPIISIHALERYCQRAYGLMPSQIQYSMKYHRNEIEKAVLKLWSNSIEIWRNAFKNHIGYRSDRYVLIFDPNTNRITTVLWADPEVWKQNCTQRFLERHFAEI